MRAAPHPLRRWSRGEHRRHQGRRRGRPGHLGKERLEREGRGRLLLRILLRILLLILLELWLLDRKRLHTWLVLLLVLLLLRDTGSRLRRGRNPGPSG